MDLQTLHQTNGATLAPDGIPLHYGDLKQEYQAALTHAILLDRSHEGRLVLSGGTRHEFLNRMTTNKTVEMRAGEGRGTIFTNPNARIIDRIEVYEDGDSLFVITEPGRGQNVKGYLQSNIFFNDQVTLTDHTPTTAQLALHGAQAEAIIQSLAPELSDMLPLEIRTLPIAGILVRVVRRKNISGSHWVFCVARESASIFYQHLMTIGQPFGITPAGSLTFNTLRIRSGQPARLELSADYLPLEVGLWDEVSFAKGCYTGQEIIARMESRGKLAKTIVALKLTQFIEAPADIYETAGRSIGTLTSSVTAPDGTIFALGIVKTSHSEPATLLQVGDKRIEAQVSERVGTQPPYITEVT